MSRALVHNLSQSFSFGSLSLKAKALWPMLLCNADNQGRGRAHPSIIKWLVCPNVNEIDIDEVPDLLQELVAQQMIHLFQDRTGQDIFQIVNWWKYQKLQWATPSEFPAPEGWIDRIRYRSSEGYITSDWDSAGGFVYSEIAGSAVAADKDPSLDETDTEPAESDDYGAAICVAFDVLEKNNPGLNRSQVEEAHVPDSDLVTANSAASTPISTHPSDYTKESRSPSPINPEEHGKVALPEDENGNHSKIQVEAESVDTPVHAETSPDSTALVPRGSPRKRIREKIKKKKSDPKGSARAISPPNASKNSSKTPRAVLVFRRAANRFPAKAWYQEVANIVGDNDSNLGFWFEVVKMWVGMGWNPTNVKGMLECYTRGELPGSRKNQSTSNEPSGFSGIRQYLEEENLQ